MLLLVWGFANLLNRSSAEANAVVVRYIEQLLPAQAGGADSGTHRVVRDILSANANLGIFSALTFVWFSTRLFGSLRTVLANVFDIEHERGIIQGKIFDIQLTIVSTILVTSYFLLTAYLAVATTRGIAILSAVGLRESLMGGVEYWMGRLLAFAFLIAMFYGLYRYLPVRRVRNMTALLAATFTSVMFELARNGFAVYVARTNPGSLYTGAIAAVVIVVLWVYYAALIFVLGGEVAQVHELRRVRRQQREQLE